MYTKLHFEEQHELNKDINYKIVEINQLTLYGTYITTNNKKIKSDAPEFYSKCSLKYKDAPYAIIEYHDKERWEVKSYWVLYTENMKGLKKKIIPKSKWIQIRINSQEPIDIQNASDTFYKEFLPNCKYNFKFLPEIEYYHDNITDFLIPIEN